EDEVRFGRGLRALVPVGEQQPRHLLRVVDVHLAAEGLDEEPLARLVAHVRRPCFTISRAWRRAVSVIVSPPSIRATSSTRSSGPRASTSVIVRPRSTRLRTA